jgi:hypothetical protein
VCIHFEGEEGDSMLLWNFGRTPLFFVANMKKKG